MNHKDYSQKLEIFSEEVKMPHLAHLSDDDKIMWAEYNARNHPGWRKKKSKYNKVHLNFVDAWRLAVLIVLMLICVRLMMSQVPHDPIIIRLKDQGTTLATRQSGIVQFNCFTGMSCSWAGSTFTMTSTGGGGTPAGNSGEIQFNSSGTFGADPDLFWNNTFKSLKIGNSVSVTNYPIELHGSPAQFMINAETAAQQATFFFADQGTTKWQFGKQGDNSLFLWDQVAASNVFYIDSNGAEFNMNRLFNAISGIKMTDAVTLSTVHGNASDVAVVTGATTTNNCAKWDVNGNLVDSGGTCGGSPAGNDGAVQYNNSGAFGGDETKLLYNDTEGRLYADDAIVGSLTAPTSGYTANDFGVVDSGGTTGALALGGTVAGNYVAGELRIGKVTAGAWSNLFAFGGQHDDTTNAATRNFYLYDYISSTYPLIVYPATTGATWTIPVVIDGTTTNTGSLNASTADTTTPWKTGTATPGTCAVGEAFYDTDATAGKNIYACTATNTWTLQGDGTGGAIIGFGAVASLPATCATGDLYRTNDSLYEYQCTATNTWTAFYYGEVVVPPPLSGWSWDNDGGVATESTTHGFLYLVLPKTSAVSGRWRCRTEPSTPYTIKATLIYSVAGEITQDGNTENSFAGIGFRESSTGKLVVIYGGSVTGGSSNIKFDKWTTSASFSAQYAAYTGSQLFHLTGGLRRYAIRNDGTDLSVYQTVDGLNWDQFDSSRAKNDFFTTAPDQICVGAYVNASSAVISLISWESQAGAP